MHLGAQALRLPTDVRPVRYAATLDITPGSDTFEGSIDIELEIQKPTSSITLHAREIEFKRVTPAPLEIRKGENDLVTLVYGQPLAAGAERLQIEYSGVISRVLTDGAFQQQRAGDWYVFTKFEPITARRVFPCFDEPGFKVPWQLTLRVPKDLKAFSNTPVESEEATADERKQIRFRQTPPLPSYLVAFAVGPFDVIETAPVGRKHVPSRIVVAKGRAAEAEYAAAITPRLIEMLESYFGSPYPYEKLDQVVVPLTTAWGAMENAGMIAYGDFFLAPRSQDSELRHQQLAVTMEHEMAHQWFGDLVTMQWWNDLWLNEAFASWISNKLVADWHPEWRINEKRAGATAIFRADSLTSARTIRQPIEAAGDIGGAFDGITYGKGQAVIGMFEHYVGAPVFQAGVREYLKAHAFGNATSDDLLAALDKAAPGSGVGGAFRTFLNQVGFPVVSVALDCAPKPHVRLTQNRLVPKGSSASESASWNVPVCLSWAAGSQCVLLTQASQTFDLKTSSCPAGIFADGGAAGYYAYSSAEPGDTAWLNQMERAAAAANERLMFSSGQGDAGDLLRKISKLAGEDDPGLVQQSASLWRSLDGLVAADSQAAYAERLRTLFGHRATELGWQPKASDTPEIRSLRAEVTSLLATRGEDAALAGEARLLADRWLNDHATLDADTVPMVLFAAAWNGKRDLFNEMVVALRRTNVQRERTWIISGLAGFRDAGIAEAALELIGSPGLDAREMSAQLFNANAETRETVWRYVQANFDRLNGMLPSARGVPFATRLPDATAGFCDVPHAEATQEFFAGRLKPMPGGSRSLARAVERIRLCAAQAELARPAVADILLRP